MQAEDGGSKLSDMIKKAIHDCEITSTEYNEILAIANEDKQIDSQEQKLLSQLQQMLANGTVKRVPG